MRQTINLDAEKDQQIKGIRRQLRQITWLMAATIILLLYLLIFG